MSFAAVVTIVCALGIGILVGFAVCRWRIWSATRRLGVAKQSQLDVTGIHHVGTRAPAPVNRPRVKKPTGE